MSHTPRNPDVIELEESDDQPSLELDLNRAHFHRPDVAEPQDATARPDVLPDSIDPGDEHDATTPPKPVLLYDGDCGFCRRWVARWQRWTEDRVTYRSAQESVGAVDDVLLNQVRNSVVYMGGVIDTGARAVFRTMTHARQAPLRWLLPAYERIPGFGPASEAVYRTVARHRIRGAHRRVTAASWLFLRAMGLVYLFAFASLWSQVDGLIGDDGILPVRDFLASVEARAGDDRFHLAPTLAWLSPSTPFLNLLCGGGVLFSLLVLAGVAQLPSLAALWLLYLSLTVAGQQFFHFQWDNLLLEAGLLAVFMAPLHLAPRAPRSSPESPLLAVFLVRFLLFKLMFLSGVVKLASGDETWRGLTALSVHYETQPLPHGLSWWAHNLPEWMHLLGTAATLAIELVLPFFVFGPSALRLIAFLGFSLLMAAIALTGNYGFFNLLTWVLCLPLLDDMTLRWALPPGPGNWLVKDSASCDLAPRKIVPAWILVPAFAVLLLLSTMTLAQRAQVDVAWPGFAGKLQEAVAPFRSLSSYGLFASMTTRRPEIVIEGSHDGRTWIAYEFKWKPGDLERRPTLAAPHMPRVDWQMWFAALGNVNRNPWLVRFMDRLLEGRPEVLALLGDNPFPDQPPRYVRALIYDYRFTGRDDGGSAYWKRELLGLYAGPRQLPTGVAGGGG